MRKKLSLIMILAMLLISLYGCGTADGSVSSSGNMKMVLLLSSPDTFRTNLANAAKSYAESKGMQLDILDSENSIEVQVGQIEQAVTDGCDVILCNPVDTDTALQLEAAAGDLPIVFFNSCPDENYLEKDKYVYVGSNEEVAGTYQAEYILEKFASKDEINIVIIKGQNLHSATEGRSNALKNALNDSGKKINYVFADNADWDTTIAKEMFDIFLKTGKQVDCVACNNDSMALGIIESCKENNVNTATLPILGIDATEQGCQAIIDGDMVFTVYQPAVGQGEAAVEAAIVLGTGKSVSTIAGASEDGKYVWVPFEKVDISNVKDYMK